MFCRLLPAALVTVLWLGLSTASADQGALELYTLAVPEMTDELEQTLYAQLAQAHQTSPLSAEHLRVIIHLTPWMKESGYGLGRSEMKGKGMPSGTEVPTFMLAGNMQGIKSGMNEIERAFKEGTLLRIKSGLRSEPVRAPLLDPPTSN